MHFLGGDLRSIAREKLGIVKPRVPLVIARPADSDILELARRECALLEAPCRIVSADEATDIRTGEDSTGFILDGRRFTTSLRGEFQVHNAVVAVRAAECAGFHDTSKTLDGIARTALPGRFHVAMVRGRIVIFDVGHNPAAAEAFCFALRRRYGEQTVCMVAGIMKDKDVAGVLRAYCLAASRLILTHPNIERAADGETLLRAVPADFTGRSDYIADVGKAVAAALTSQEHIVCIAGSFHTVGEAMQALNIEPYGPRNAPGNQK
jgi:dihydrofolate synthase/folylpolyglutamate synthase